MTEGLYYGSQLSANPLTQIRALASTAHYNRWDREREREKENEKKRKKKSEFEMHLQSELKQFPEEAGYYFEARA